MSKNSLQYLWRKQRRFVWKRISSKTTYLLAAIAWLILNAIRGIAHLDSVVENLKGSHVLATRSAISVSLAGTSWNGLTAPTVFLWTLKVKIAWMTLSVRWTSNAGTRLQFIRLTAPSNAWKLMVWRTARRLDSSRSIMRTWNTWIISRMEECANRCLQCPRRTEIM